MPITVVLAEDNALLRHGLARLIDSAPDLQLVGAAADLGVKPGKIEDYGPSLGIYQGICRQFQAGKPLIVVIPPRMGA